jgi:hypothetical protein
MYGRAPDVTTRAEWGAWAQWPWGALYARFMLLGPVRRESRFTDRTRTHFRWDRGRAGRPPSIGAQALTLPSVSLDGGGSRRRAQC